MEPLLLLQTNEEMEAEKVPERGYRRINSYGDNLRSTNMNLMVELNRWVEMQCCTSITNAKSFFLGVFGLNILGIV